MILETNCPTILGKWLYSDVAYNHEFGIIQNPMLNQAAKIPFIGIVAGVSRCALATIHISGHLLASTCNREHLKHALKGGAEFVRGLVETTPIVGRIFAWKVGLPPCLFDPPPHYCFRHFFLVRINNLSQPDDFALGRS